MFICRPWAAKKKRRPMKGRRDSNSPVPKGDSHQDVLFSHARNPKYVMVCLWVYNGVYIYAYIIYIYIVIYLFIYLFIYLCISCTSYFCSILLSLFDISFRSSLHFNIGPKKPKTPGLPRLTTSKLPSPT